MSELGSDGANARAMLDGGDPAHACISHGDKETQVILIGLESELQANYGFPLEFCGRGLK